MKGSGMNYFGQVCLCNFYQLRIAEFGIIHVLVVSLLTLNILVGSGLHSSFEAPLTYLNRKLSIGHPFLPCRRRTGRL